VLVVFVKNEIWDRKNDVNDRSQPVRTRRWGHVRVGNVIENKEDCAKRIPSKNNRKGGERRDKRVSMTNDD